MKSFDIRFSKRRPFFYVVDFNFPTVEIITGTVFYLCSVSTSNDNRIIIKNLSKEKYTASESSPFPAIGTSGGTPYFFINPWRLEGGTLLEISSSPGGQNILLSGYNHV